MREKELLLELMAIPSFSDEELEVCNFVLVLLQTLDFDQVEKIPVDENGFNILATKGEPAVMLQAHLDVVKPNITSSEKDGKIFGRGSCDTKASVASMITAAEKALAESQTDFALLFTVGEEKDFRGIEKFVAERDNWPFAVVGEPTNLQAANGQYGLLNLEVKTEGKAAHTSIADQGINAIDKLLTVVSRLSQLEVQEGSSQTLAMINGGIADNIVPDKASALFNLRIRPDDKTDYLARFQEIVDNYEAARLEKGLDLPAVLTALPEKLSFLGETKFVKGGTELSFLKNGIILGPGDMTVAHSDKEFVEINELQQATQIYLEIIKALAQ
jgi:acetylornithine deacetylase